MALRTSSQVMSAILIVLGSGAVSGRLANARTSTHPDRTIMASFGAERRRASPLSRPATVRRMADHSRRRGEPNSGILASWLPALILTASRAYCRATVLSTPLIAGIRLNRVTKAPENTGQTSSPRDVRHRRQVSAMFVEYPHMPSQANEQSTAVLTARVTG